MELVHFIILIVKVMIIFIFNIIFLSLLLTLLLILITYKTAGSNLHTITETEAKVSPKPPFIKRILLVDDVPDITLTFKAGLEGYRYGDKKRFEVYTYKILLFVFKNSNQNFMIFF